MTRDDIIRMAHEAYCSRVNLHTDQKASISRLMRFAALVAAIERDACAKVCDEKVGAEYATGKVDHNEMGWTQACAIDIRARGQG